MAVSVGIARYHGQRRQLCRQAFSNPTEIIMCNGLRVSILGSTARYRCHDATHHQWLIQRRSLPDQRSRISWNAVFLSSDRLEAGCVRRASYWRKVAVDEMHTRLSFQRRSCKRSRNKCGRLCRYLPWHLYTAGGYEVELDDSWWPHRENVEARTFHADCEDTTPRGCYAALWVFLLYTHILFSIFLKSIWNRILFPLGKIQCKKAMLSIWLSFFWPWICRR